MKNSISFKVIRSIYLNSTTLNATITSLITDKGHYHMNKNEYGEDVFDEQILRTIKNHILSDEFVNSIAKEYDETFTPDELEELLKIHRSPVMRKFNENYEELFSPLFNSMKKYINRYIGVSSVWRVQRDKSKMRQFYDLTDLNRTG